MLANDGGHVFCTAVTNFQVIFVKDAVKSMGFRKMLVY